MSWAASGYVKKLRMAPNGEPITKGEKLVLFVLADYYHDEVGYAWASLSHLATESLHSRQGVILTLKSLEQKGVLSVIRSADAVTKRVVNRYCFPGLAAGCVPSTQAVAPRDLVKPVDQTSQATLPVLVKPVDQTSQATLPVLVKPVDHIFPSYLSNDLSKDSSAGAAPGPAIRSSPPGKKRDGPKSAAAYLAYADAHKGRYGVEPVRNAKANALLCQLVDRLGAEEAPLVAAFYLSLDTRPYAAAGHPLNLLVRDCEALRTQWKRGPRRVPTDGPKACQPVPPMPTSGAECPPDAAAKLAKILGRDAFSFPAEVVGV